MKNGREFQKHKPQQRNLVPMGSKVYIHATHPTNKKAIYLCEARIVRQPRRKDDERYKVVITGVQSFGGETEQFLSRLIGMKIIRHSKGINTEKPWKYSSEGKWTRLDESAAERLVKRTISNIRKDAFLQRKNRPIPRLD